MGSTSFRFACPECGRHINWDHYWNHVTRCVKQPETVARAAIAKAKQKPTKPR